MLLTLAACSSDDDATRIKPTASGSVTDSDGNEYKWVRLGGLDWTTSNALNGPTMCDLYYITSWGSKSNFFSSSEKTALKSDYIPVYGNLMSYEEAVKSAPEGWRLPTDDDWKALERALGMGGVDAKGWRGTSQASIMSEGDDGSGLSLCYGGAILFTTESTALHYMMEYEKIAGYYWTATIDNPSEDSKTAFTRKIIVGKGSVERQSMRVDNRYLSVRWVRDAK